VSGELRINGELVGAGDGMQIRQEDSVNITALSESEFLLFNLS
jgi:redox-sensitive bicupin YhaK (pirin superfamily)